MKKSLIFFFILTMSVGASAQFFVDSNIPYKYYTDYSSNGLNYLLMFEHLQTQNPGDYAEIDYSVQGSNFVWDKYQNGTRTFYSSSTTNALLNLDLEASVGYVLSVDGIDVLTIWVIDYSAFLPNFSSIDWDKNSDSQCETLPLLIDAQIPAIQYQNLNGTSYNVTRNFDLLYTTLEFKESWNPVEQKEIIVLPDVSVDVKAPLANTTFLLSGDQFAKDLGVEISFESDEYQAFAVSASPITILTTRGFLNEKERPDDSSKRSGSAPLEIEFKANPTPNVQYYNWVVSRDGIQLFTRKEENHRHTFREHGKYDVRLTVSSDLCAYTDSTIVIEVSESELLIPKVFTPNGDGLNDEFRVAYKSLIEFEAWVYNRWGRLVYHWTDPTQGWNGKINGKNAAEGAYFYVIKAKGSDGLEYQQKGDINLLRGKK